MPVRRSESVLQSVADGIFAFYFLAFAVSFSCTLYQFQFWTTLNGLVSVIVHMLADFLLSYLKWEILFPKKGELSFPSERALT